MIRISLVRAPNPSAMTLSGTNSYIIDDGSGNAICIDPGPDIASHVESLMETCRNLDCELQWICLTHGHPDHAPAAAPLQRATGAKIVAHSLSEARHDRDLADGDLVEAGAVRLSTMEAPGHCADHVVFYENEVRALFTGDTIIGEGYVLITPPDGDMRAYQKTLQRLLQQFPEVETIYGGHGEPVTAPLQKIRDYIAHRCEREAKILKAFRDGKRTIADLTAEIYPGLDPALDAAAGAQIEAHLLALQRDGTIEL